MLKNFPKIRLPNQRWRRRIIRIALLSISLPILACIGFTAAVHWMPYADEVGQIRGTSTFFEDRNGIALAAFASDDGQWRLPLTEDQVSPQLRDAIVAVEDERFYQHAGVDWRSAAGAAWEDMRHLRARRGASTITMQVQRMIHPAPRTFCNKLLESIHAEQLERRLDKRQILLQYVNRAPFGGNLVGAGAASWRYFGRPCDRLSLAECALLAGLPQSPNRLRPDLFPLRAAARRNHVLDRMLANHMITQTAHDHATAEPVGASWRGLPQERSEGQLPAADAALPLLLRLAHERSAPTSRATIDSIVQRQVAAMAAAHLRDLDGSGIGAAAIVVLDTHTAECLADVSLGADDLMMDLTDRPRSTGSTLKPFIYAAAFDEGICTTQTVLTDAPSAWPEYEPNDYDHGFRGQLTAAEALAESRNIPAMLVLARLGAEPALGTMDAAGLHALARSPQRYGLSLAIGGAEATPLELAEAYATLARGGTHLPIRLLHSPPGPPVVQPHGARCLRAQSCWQVLHALSAVERTRAIYPACAANHVAWKTGTSGGHRDAWCAAVTRRRTCVVWLGNVRAEATPSLVGQEVAAPLALRLISMLDPADEPWPLVVEQPPGQWRPEIGDRQLLLVAPATGQQFVLARDMPTDRQRVRLRAAYRGSNAEPGKSLWWFVDDIPIGQSRTATDHWWNAIPGSHQVRVVDSQGRSASALISVRAAE